MFDLGAAKTKTNEGERNLQAGPPLAQIWQITPVPCKPQ